MNAHRERILITDDDSEVRHLLRLILVGEQYQVFEASDGGMALQILEIESPDLVILDIMMPKMNGLDMLKSVRRWSSVPVIMVSARSGMGDKTECLDLGADDYITKPFAINELLARVRAVLRRSSATHQMPTMPCFSCGDLQIDFAERKVTVAGRQVRLTSTEYWLLQELALNAGKVLTYQHLLHRVWGPEYESEKDHIHLYVHYLRSKIESDPKHPKYILNVSGAGYILTSNQ
jgi:two-component system KDP operon response regulator KdpE